MIKVSKDRVNLFIGLASLLLTIAFFVFEKGSKKYDLRYFYVEAKSIFDESIFNIDEVQLNWIKGSSDGKETSLEVHSLDNLYQTRFFIWSQGEEFIGKNEFIDGNLFKMKFNPLDIKIISRKSYTSRNGLVLKSTVDEKEGVISFFWENEQEGFEKNDGLVVDLFHTGESESRFFIESRIKGAINGLSAFDLARGINQENRLSTYIMVVFFAFLSGGFSLKLGYIFLTKGKEFENIKENPNPFVSKKIFLSLIGDYIGAILSLALVLMLAYVSYKLFFGIFDLESRLIPEWIFSFR